MNNPFAAINLDQVKDEIKSYGPSNVYKPGLHKVINTDIYVYEGKYGVTSEIVFETEDEGTFTTQLKATPNTNQTEATTNLLSYMGKLAIVNGREKQYTELKTKFGTLPKVNYKDKFNNEVKAYHIKLFNNLQYSILTYTEISGDANKIFTNQELDLLQVFSKSNASVSEIKDNKEPGGTYTYFQKPENYLKRTRIKYAADGRFESNPTLQEAETFIQPIVSDQKFPVNSPFGFTTAGLFPS